MRSPFPLKKGEGMKREGACLSIRTAQDFSTWSVALLLPSVEMTISSCHPERAREWAAGARRVSPFLTENRSRRRGEIFVN